MKSPQHEATLILECRKGHRWYEKVRLPMIVEAFLGRLEGMKICPTCGDKKTYMLLGERYREAHLALLGTEAEMDEDAMKLVTENIKKGGENWTKN